MYDLLVVILCFLSSINSNSYFRQFTVCDIAMLKLFLKIDLFILFAIFIKLNVFCYTFINTTTTCIIYSPLSCCLGGGVDFEISYGKIGGKMNKMRNFFQFWGNFKFYGGISSSKKGQNYPDN